MSSNAFVGVGTQFLRETDTPGTYAALAEVNSIDGPNMERQLVDVTSLDSTGGYREYKPGFRDGGSVRLNMNWTEAVFNQMLDDFQSNSPRNYKIVMVDTGASTITFAGYVMNMPSAVPTDDKVTLDVEIKVTGAPDLVT